MSILLFILILFVLVVVHELGHFVVAKMFGVRVDEFGVGYPPRALSFGRLRGTEYTLNWLPFGGFVKIYGEDGDGVSDAERRVSLAHKSPIVQILVLCAGVCANVALAWGLFWYAAAHGAPIAIDESSPLVHRAQLVITDVVEASPAEVAGIQANDRLVGLSSRTDALKKIVPSEVTAFIQAHAGEKLTLSLQHTTDGVAAVRTVTVTPVQGLAGATKPAVGIAMGLLLQEQFGFFDSCVLGWHETWGWLGDTAFGLWRLVAGAFVGGSSIKDVSGPVGIASQVGNWYNLGPAYLAYFAAIISVNLAIINLVPLPALDGGRVVFVVVESVIRRRLPMRATTFVNAVGFMLLIALMLVVTWNDVWRLVG